MGTLTDHLFDHVFLYLGIGVIISILIDLHYKVRRIITWVTEGREDYETLLDDYDELVQQQVDLTNREAKAKDVADKKVQRLMLENARLVKDNNELLKRK